VSWQKAKGKRQKAKGKRQKAKGKRQKIFGGARYVISLKYREPIHDSRFTIDDSRQGGIKRIW
jgi:hypothetical protein